MSSSSPMLSQLPEEVRGVLRRFLSQIKKIQPEHTIGIILYGSLARGEYVIGRSNINVCVFLKEITADYLGQCATFQNEWGKSKIIPPLLLTENDLQASVKLFPLEYGEMKDSHLLLDGQDLLGALPIDDQNLARQCQQEIFGNLIRLRQQCIEGMGKSEALFALLPISLTALLPCIRGLYRLLNKPVSPKYDGLLNQLQVYLEVDPNPFHEVWLLKRGMASPGTHEFPRLFQRYLVSLEALHHRVQRLTEEGQLS